MLKGMKLSTRILLLGISIIVCFSLTFAWVIPKVKNSMYEAKYTKTKHVVESAWGVLDYYAKQAKAKTMPVEEAKKKAMEAVKNLRYDLDDYFWINDLEPRMVMHPIKAEMDGKNLSEEKDPNGKRFFVAMVETSKSNGAGFVDYFWAKPGSTKPVPKISYVKLFPEWGWIIGSGIYLDDVAAEVSHMLYVIFGIVAVIGVGGLGLSYFMARSISRPINRIIAGLSDGSEQVASASAQVSSAGQSLAEGASEQAAGLEETSSSMEEMASMTKQNADNSQQAKTMMGEVNQIVENVNHHMGNMAKAIVEITKSSEETGKIIKTIDEIAFQTNLLALNAAVEAARAGEAGAGFAVVADEVRNLAMRASEAAKNTNNLIDNTIKAVKNGNDLTVQTQEAFKKNVEISIKIGKLVDEISAASQEQSQGIGQVSKAVAEMDQVVQKNAANAEESASAAEEMNGQAEQMKMYVQELVAVVGGSGNGNGVAAFEKDQNIGISNSHSTSAGPSPGIGGRETVTASAKKEKKIERVALHKDKEVKPEQVIPLEKEFKEF